MEWKSWGQIKGLPVRGSPNKQARIYGRIFQISVPHYAKQCLFLGQLKMLTRTTNDAIITTDVSVYDGGYDGSLKGRKCSWR